MRFRVQYRLKHSTEIKTTEPFSARAEAIKTGNNLKATSAAVILQFDHESDGHPAAAGKWFLDIVIK